MASEQGAPCGVHQPERKLRMKLLGQAKMVTRAPCLSPGCPGGESSPAVPGRVFGLPERAEQSDPVLGSQSFLTLLCILPLCASSLPTIPTFSAFAVGASRQMLVRGEVCRAKSSKRRSASASRRQPFNPLRRAGDMGIQGVAAEMPVEVA